MNFLKFKFVLCRLKKQYKVFLKVEEKYLAKNLEKRKFIAFFIKDDEDKFLNKEVIDNFDKQIKKCKVKLYKKKLKLNKTLFSLGIFDLNYIDIFYKYKASEKDIEFVKNVLKDKISGRC